VSQKVSHGFLLQLKAVWNDVHNSWHTIMPILKSLAYKCIRNVPPHLSYISTLPENTLASQQSRWK